MSEVKKKSLAELFGTDKKAEKDGIRFLVEANGSEFFLKRFGGANSASVQQTMTKYYKPVAKLIEKNILQDEQRQAIETRVFVESCLTGWKNVELVEGEDLPFSVENALKLFKEFPDLLEVLVSYASDYSNFKEDLGN